MNNATLLYAYLQNNRPGIDELARYCQSNHTQVFGTITADNLVNLFQYDFGKLNQTIANQTEAAANETNETAGADTNAGAGEVNTEADAGADQGGAADDAGISVPGSGSR